MIEQYKKSYAQKRVLITGGAGGIGSNLTRALLSLDADVLVIDDFSSAYLWNIPSTRIRLVEDDILNTVALDQTFAWRPQIVYHLAAFFANQNSVEHPGRDLLVNGMGTLRVLQKCVDAGVERVLFASSSSVYGKELRLPLDEATISLSLSTPYQVTKLLGELYCNYFYGQLRLPAVRLRFSNSYGPGEVPGRYRNVIPNFMFAALRGLPLTITGSGEETRDFTFVGDIVDGLLRAGYLDCAVGEVFNLASNRETRIGDLATMINELTENRAPICYTERRTWDHGVRRCLSSEKAQRMLGFKPAVTVAEGLVPTLGWFRENWPDIQGAAEAAGDKKTRAAAIS